MHSTSLEFAAISQATSHDLALSGSWTACGINAVTHQLDSVLVSSNIIADCSCIVALDTAGAWVLQKFLLRLGKENGAVTLQGMKPQFMRLLNMVSEQMADESKPHDPVIISSSTVLERVGCSVESTVKRTLTLLAFIGATAVAFALCVAHPARIRWRPILYNIRSSGFDALPIVGLLSFLLGVVVAYQGADQLKQYGANIFVVDLIGLSMLREFAPLITAIIIAGRSGSAYAAQIGTMVVSEEIDAMRTLGISPQELLVLPKFIALVIALPLLTVFADFLGVFGGMLMASTQLGVGFGEFLNRFVKAVSLTSYMIGIGKALVFAAIIVTIGCFQGFRTKGGAESVGKQTTRSVVQSIFLVVVADALFSVIFSALGI